jgi:hypothetical protein
VPPIREVIRVANSLAAKARSQDGLTLIPSEVLHQLCQVAQSSRGPPSCQTVCEGETAAQVSCRRECDDASEGADAAVAPEPNELAEVCVDVVFEWGDSNQTLNPCNFTWEIRQLEPTLAMCASAIYLTDDPIDISDVTGAFTGHDKLRCACQKSPRKRPTTLKRDLLT